VARQQQIAPRVLLAAAYSQSSFGQPSDPGLMQAAGRPSLYALPIATTGPIAGNDVVANSRLLAGKMAEVARASSPADPFDWLVIAANIIVGQVTEDTNFRDLALRSVLLDLVATYNRGFSTVTGTDTIALPSLSENEQIKASDLDERQSQYINGFRLRRDFGSDFFLAGPDLGSVAEKDTNTVPRLLVIWCPSNNLVCLEHYRTNKTTPVHFLATRSMDGGLETTQFYPVAQDLVWYGNTLKNTTILAVSGLAGRTRENFRPDWLAFNEYASLRVIIRNIFDQTLRKFFGPEQADKMLADANTFRSNTSEFRTPAKDQLGFEPPEGASDYGLPVFWDSDVFFEVLTAERPSRIKEQMLISSPAVGQEFSNSDVPFRITLTDDIRMIEIYQDFIPTAAHKSPWDLAIKREVNPQTRKIETFTHPFTRPGSLPSNHRAVKIVARGEGGELLASQVIRFQVRTIKSQ
jgi:hypothetical protein